MTGFPYSVKCEISFTAPGVAASWVDITSRLIAFRCDKGQQYDYDGPQPGTLTVTLDDTDGAFDPTNTSGIYYPNVKLKRQVRVSAQLTSVSARVYLAHGYIDTITRSWPGGLAFSETVLECTDAVQFFNRTIYAGLVVAAGTADLHMQVIGNAATPAPAGGLAVVGTTYTGNAWDFITNLAIADGGLFYANGNDGATIYLTSTYLQTSTRSTVVQEAFAFGLAAGTEVQSDSLTPALDDRLVANSITVVDSAGAFHTVTDAASQTDYGVVPFEIDTRGPGGTGLTAAAAVTRAKTLKARRSQPDQRIDSLTLDALTGDQQMTDALTLQMGDLVTLTTQPLGGGSAATKGHLITSIGHDVDLRDPRWEVTYQLEPSSAYVKPVTIETDNFNRTNNSSSIGGSGWTIVARQDTARTTTWGITSNTAYCSADATVSSSLYESLAVRSGTAADFDMTLTIASLVTSPFNAPIACWRVNLAADDGAFGLSYFALMNGYGIVFYPTGAGQAGPYGSAVTFAAGDVVRIVVTGNTHQVYQNGVLVSTATRIENNTQTAHGLASYGPSFAHATFDDFSLTY